MRAITIAILAALVAVATPATAQEPTVEVTIEILESSRDHAIILCESLRTQNRSVAPAPPWTLKECAERIFAMAMRSLEDRRTRSAREEVANAVEKEAAEALQLMFPDRPGQPER